MVLPELLNPLQLKNKYVSFSPKLWTGKFTPVTGITLSTPGHFSPEASFQMFDENGMKLRYWHILLKFKVCYLHFNRES